MSQFFDHGKDDAKDDLDPELKMNPVVMARVEMERAERQKKTGKKIWAPGTMGPLAKLGFRISSRAKEGSSPKGGPHGPHQMKQIDMMVKKANEASASGAGPSAAGEVL